MVAFNALYNGAICIFSSGITAKSITNAVNEYKVFKLNIHKYGDRNQKRNWTVPATLSTIIHYYTILPHYLQYLAIADNQSVMVIHLPLGQITKI